MLFSAFGLSLVFSLLMCLHVVRTGRELFWVFIILIAQPFGGLIYGVAIVLPDLLGGTTARRVASVTRDTLDPSREYRQARAAYDDSPTVANAIRLGQAAAGMGRHEEAERLFRESAQGVHAEDPTLLLGHANALLELGRYDEALEDLDRLGSDKAQGRSPQAALALGRAYEGLGRFTEADTAYDWRGPPARPGGPRALRRLPGPHRQAGGGQGPPGRNRSPRRPRRPGVPQGRPPVAGSGRGGDRGAGVGGRGVKLK